MDKNTVIGLVLIFALLTGYSYLNRPTQEQIERTRRYNDSIALIKQSAAEQQAAAIHNQNAEQVPAENISDSLFRNQLQATYGNFADASQGNEEFITLENELMILQLSTKGGRIYSVRLKNFTDYEDNPLILFQGDEGSFSATLVTENNRVINTGDLFFEASADNNPLQANLRLQAGDGAYLEFVYTLHEDDYMVDFKITPHQLANKIYAGTTQLDILWTQKIKQQEIGRKFEERYACMNYKYLSDDVEQMSESKDDSKSIANKLKWIGYKDQFFSSAFIAQENFGSTQLDSKHLQGGRYIKSYSTATSVDFDPKSEKTVHLNFYFGPNDYNLLRSYDKTKFEGQDLQLEKLVPLGWSLFRYVNKWIVIPIFDFLTEWMNIGLSILLLTLIIKICLFPLIYKSLMSSAKMRVMKPQIEAITAKYPGQENAVARQQKTMELYKQVGINPLGGCLPMLLQLPFTLGLFWFFPSAIELRHQGFLWATDLSAYDAVIKWDANIPLVTPYFGNHISIFCLLMTVVNIIYTKYNMEQSNTGQEQMPGMKAMMYVMPVFMLIFLNSYPAGLNYYYFISTLIAILQTVLFRYFLNEESLLKRLEANKKNPPKKKSGFMAKLEEAQRQQQALLKEQQKKNNRKR
ncbi:MAG: membrane protein insertase YidC [Candidatus Symbiothrix sp.]|jgi:YidC/Oxa1 family membrane protein insertase|nr:membrane protein insertase YidC [Candidatus Symbiothrix sp.]